MRRLRLIVVVLGVAFAAAQLIRPGRANPPVDPARTIQAHAGTSRELAAVLDRSCGDCHSNATVWRWYTNVAPTSWLMAYGVNEGRKAVNFSMWADYPPETRQLMLSASCRDASDGKMPGIYSALVPETKLSARDIETICAAARETRTSASGRKE